MTLREKQSLFARHVAKLIERAYATGYEVTFGETWRHPKMAEYYASKGLGIKTSLHTQRLAIDLNLFLNGKYLTASEDYAPLGRWWMRQHRLARWGGTFRNRDGNHFSFAHGGRA